MLFFTQSYNGDLLSSKEDRRNSSHFKYVREQLTKLGEEELASQQQLFNLRAKQQNAMDKLTVEQNEKFSRIFGALLRAKLSDEVQQIKIDQMKQMLSKDRETLQKKQRGEFFAAESDMVGIVKKIIEFKQSISSDNPESPNTLVPIRRVPSSLLQGPGSGGSSITRDEEGSTLRSVNLDRGEKNTDITLAEFNPKNPDQVSHGGGVESKIERDGGEGGERMGDVFFLIIFHTQIIHVIFVLLTCLCFSFLNH
jgi:hypothetical protein